VPEVTEAMAAVNDTYIEMAELLARSGEYIADLLGVEAAYVTSGCSAALAFSAAACMTGRDLDKIGRIPDTTGMKSEIVIQKAQRYSYDRSFTVPGATLVEAGDDDGCSREQLEAAIGDNTAAVAYLVRPGDPESVLTLEQAVEIAHDAGVPVIADAAAQIYPLDYFRRNAQAADIACFGAKYMGAPQSSGFLCGKKELVDAAAAQGFIGFHTGGFRAIGRPLKVTRDGVVAVVAAVRAWLTMDHESRLLAIEERLAAIQRRLSGTPNVATDLVHNPRHYWGSSLNVVLDTGTLGRNAEEVAAELDAGDPRIWVTAEGEDTIIVRAHELREDEEAIVADRLRAALTS
jgi:L-seryl-tRNA(Ser) seleniumtransferase